ncbi:hypothetical protein ALQ64_03139 [Pseudomonas cannabina]|uniref:Lipoprotein n=1 Tax=Pseudomonas cannabina TaxID=86840 RepID=A0A3M3K2J7_PSECA|nr:hypothetical protein [Pseudomonas cannabina]RMN17113.1 hypothetical protein ALQ64_03139 [Pseudomonas cannabina]
MKLTLSALTAALLACTAHAQDAGPATNSPVWRVVVTQTTIVRPEPRGDAVSSLSLDVPDDQCRIGSVHTYDHRGRKGSDKNIKLCVGKIDGLPTVTGWVLPDHIQQDLAAGKFQPGVDLYESFSFGFDGSKALLKSLTYTVSVTKL